jgi:hypothetical protein
VGVRISLGALRKPPKLRGFALRASPCRHAQIVAVVGEAAGHDHGVDAAQVAVAVPEEVRIGKAAARHELVDLVAGAGEANDTTFHAAPFPLSSVTS